MALNYAQRLDSFAGFWDDDLAVARQLAAIGHVCDRPPLEALDEGSHCITCDTFVKRELSVKALGGRNAPSGSYERSFDFNFHQPSCLRLQVRIPLEPQSHFGLYGFKMQEMRAKWERRIEAGSRPHAITRAKQTSSLFSLPTELRLEIYKQVLPSLDAVTPIYQLNRDSARVITSLGYQKTGPRDTTKVNILRTCRAVHEEAADLLYSHTKFEFAGTDGTKVLYIFLRSVGQAGRDLVKSIDVQCGNREDAIAFALLASCEKLRSITVRLPRPVILFSRPPLWCVDGMACLLHLSGLEDVKFDERNAVPRYPWMSDDKPDAAVIRRELTRLKDSPGDTSITDQTMEISQQ